MCEMDITWNFITRLKKQLVLTIRKITLLMHVFFSFHMEEEGLMNYEKKPDGSFIMLSIDIGKYIEHLSHISIKYFQYELFILQLYNIIMKQWMWRFASFRIRNNTSVENFANNLDLEHKRDILNQRKRNGSSSFAYIRYSSSSQFIHAIDAIMKALPHTNASARKIKMLESVCNIILA